MTKIALCLWFNDQAEQAADFYVSIFRACGQAAAIEGVARYGDVGPGPEGSVLAVSFALAGQDVIALNGGSSLPFSPAVSLFVKCADQAEIDEFWTRLSNGGAAGQCGWLTDKFGVSWQVVPTALGDMLQDADPVRAGRVMQALLTMTKLDLETLKHAYDAEPPL